MKSRYLVFFLPLIVAKYTSAETVQPFHSPEESVNSQFYLPHRQVMMIRLSAMIRRLILRAMR